MCFYLKDYRTYETYLSTRVTSRKKSGAGLQPDICHTLDLCLWFLSSLSNTKASNDCTTETQSYPGRFCKDRLAWPCHCDFLMKDSGWLAAKTFEMTPALKPGYNSDRALCVWSSQTSGLMCERIWLVFLPLSAAVLLESERERSLEMFILLFQQVTLWKFYFSHEYVYLPSEWKWK